MFRRALIAGLALVATGCDDLKYRPSHEEIGFIERTVVLPEGRQLAEFVRYYAATTDDAGERTVHAAYISGIFNGSLERTPVLEAISPSILIVTYDDLPDALIMDGGCGVMHITYTPRTHRIGAPICNGVA